MIKTKSPKAIDKTVGIQVRAARREARLTQEQLGDQLGITFQQIQKYEKGVNRVSAGTLFEIARLLDRPVSWFFHQDELDWRSVMGDTQSDQFRACIALLVQFQEMKALNSALKMLQSLSEASRHSASNIEVTDEDAEINDDTLP